MRDWLRRIGITRTNLRWYRVRRISSDWFLNLYMTSEQRKWLVRTGDPVRYGTMFLAIEQLQRDRIAGSLAECGVFRGSLSKFLHESLPDRKLFLFDTFTGFDHRDSETENDKRFRDTSESSVLSHIGSTVNIFVRKGYFPETARGLQDETFALVMVDFDKYEPTLAALNLFYPLLAKGAFMFVHDFSNPESNWACSRALNEFLADKPERPILTPDAWGTAVFRKI